MKEIQQECARSYRSNSKRLCRQSGEIIRVLGDDDTASPDDRSCKDMPVFGVAGQTLFESQRNINHGFRERVSQFLSQMVYSAVIPAFPPQISFQFRQNPFLPVRPIHPIPSGLKQNVAQEGPEECACV